MEELINDYQAFGRQHGLEILGRGLYIGEIWKLIKATPTLPDHPNLPPLPDDIGKSVNLIITLINQANYLLDKLIVSLKIKHQREGGFTERLYRERKQYRGY